MEESQRTGWTIAAFLLACVVGSPGLKAVGM
jgi:hypothetical protein